MAERRTVLFVSDGTGITVQMLGHSLLTQFEGLEVNEVTLPFIDSLEKPELFGRAMVIVGLAEGIAIYGLIVSVILIGKA